MLTSEHLVLSVLISHLEAKGFLVPGELADLLDHGADQLAGDRPVVQELRGFAAALRGRQPPKLTPIEGGKTGA